MKGGLNRIVIDANKRAVQPWKRWQTEAMPADEWQRQKAHAKAAGEAVICGAISGSLEVIDVDLKYDTDGHVRPSLFPAIPEAIRARLLVIETKSGGWHLYYRCPVIAGNMKLAQRHTTEGEQNGNPNDKVRVLIETRGEGGYVAAPPTDGYSVVSGEVIPDLTPDERETLLEVCRSFNTYIEEQREPTAGVVSGSAGAATQYRKSPFDDYNERGREDMLRLLQESGWTIVAQRGPKVVFKRPGQSDSPSSGDYHTELNLFSVFTTSTQFEPGKGYSPAAVYCLLVCGGDWKACYQSLVNEGYGEKRTPQRERAAKVARELVQEGMDELDVVRHVAKAAGVDMAQAQAIVKEASAADDIGAFWKVSERGVVKIDPHALYRWLHYEQGFGLYWIDNDHGKEYRIVQVQSKVMREATREMLIKAVRAYLAELPDMVGDVMRSDIEREFMESSTKLFSPVIMEHLERHEARPLQHRVDVAYFPFKNGVAVVQGGQQTRVIPYNEAPGHIWERHIIKHRFDPDADIVFGLDDCVFYKFVRCVCGHDEFKTAYAMQLIGYMLHQFKHPARSWAVILCEETDDEDQGGGTGKGIFFKGVSEMVRTVLLDGKNFKLDKGFALQRVEIDTQFVAIEDCRRSVDFEGFYSMITEGLTIEKKNQQEFYIPYQQAPKFGFSTNYTVNINGNHGARRVKILEFSPFFGKHRTPADHFGHTLFKDWDADEWNRFYNFMTFCCYQYLVSGVNHVESSESLIRKRIRLECGEAFSDWWGEFVGKIEDGEAYQFGAMYDDFCGQQGVKDEQKTKTRFGTSLKKAAELFGLALSIAKSGAKRVYVFKKS
jgi:hypothetical protein